MLWWILLIVVALVVIGWGVRRSRAGKARHPDQAAINAERKRQQGRGFGLEKKPLTRQSHRSAADGPAPDHAALRAEPDHAATRVSTS
jgi:hypothetical protein